MRMSKTTITGIACGVVCALCVGLYLASVRGEVDEARAAALERYGGDQIEVCVAKRDLAAGEVVDGSAIVTKLWVADLLPDGAVTDAAQIVGKRLGSSIVKGEVITARRTEAAAASLSVPTGKAAISVPARAVQAVGGSVEAGMTVDVYATGPVSTTKLVAGALVLATSAAAEGSAAAAEWVTLAVEPERVQEIVAAAQNLELYFALPAIGDGTEATAADGEAADLGVPAGQAAPAASENGASAVADDAVTAASSDGSSAGIDGEVAR